jgi:hypothetical protein
LLLQPDPTKADTQHRFQVKASAPTGPARCYTVYLHPAAGLMIIRASTGSSTVARLVPPTMLSCIGYTSHGIRCNHCQCRQRSLQAVTGTRLGTDRAWIVVSLLRADFRPGIVAGSPFHLPSASTAENTGEGECSVGDFGQALRDESVREVG